MFAIHTVGDLDGYLGLADPCEALENCYLAVVIVGIRWDPMKELLQDKFTCNKILVPCEWD